VSLQAAAAYSAAMNDELYAVAWALLDDAERAAVVAYPTVELPTRAVQVLEPLGLVHRTQGLAGEDVYYLEAEFLHHARQTELGGD